MLYFLSHYLILKFHIITFAGIFAFAAYRAQPALSNIIYGINSLEYGSKIITNLFNALKNADAKKISENLKIKVKDDFGLKSSLTFKDIELIYDNNNKGIKNINFSLDCPSLFLLVGPSGSVSQHY